MQTKAERTETQTDTDRHRQTHTDTDARVVCFADCFAASVPQLSRVLLFERVRLLKIPTSHENMPAIYRCFSTTTTTTTAMHRHTGTDM